MSATLATPIEGPMAWTGEDLAGTTDWIRALTTKEIEELEAAVCAARSRGLTWQTLAREDFVTPALDRTLAEVAEALERGRGLVLLRGIPVERYSDDDLRLLYWGLGLHLGTPRYQNGNGELIGDVRDENRLYGGVREVNPMKAGEPRTSRNKARSAGPLRFHTDRTDVVGLLCVRQAMKGGVSTLASTPAIHNAILAKRPDLLDALFTDYWRSRFGEEGTGKDGEGKNGGSTTRATAYPLPIFGVRDGKLTSHYSLTFIEAAQLADDIPKLTPAQKEAIDVLMATAQELCFEMTLEPGDLQLINSHVTYHGRTPFEDDADSGHDRLLFRLWLSMPNNRALPEGHEVLWRNIEANKVRGGIAQVAI